MQLRPQRVGGKAGLQTIAARQNQATEQLRFVGQSEEAPPAACPETSAAASTRKT